MYGNILIIIKIILIQLSYSSIIRMIW